MYIGTNRLSYYSYCILSCIYIVWCIRLIMYCMVERWEQYRHIASLLLPLLLLLIVIYDGVGKNSKTIIMDWYMLDDNVNQLVEFDAISAVFPRIIITILLEAYT